VRGVPGDRYPYRDPLVTRQNVLLADACTQPFNSGTWPRLLQILEFISGSDDMTKRLHRLDKTQVVSLAILKLINQNNGIAKPQPTGNVSFGNDKRRHMANDCKV
jgi:hypothetical protein